MTTLSDAQADTLAGTLFGARLLQARTRCAWSLRELATRMEGKVSAAALNKYEQGAMHPSPPILAALCEVLGTTEDFFARPMTARLGEVHFRKRSSLPVKAEKSLLEETSDFFERYIELEELMGVTDAFVNPISDITVTGAKDVEHAALELRREWGMGRDAIPSVVGLMESKHLLVHVLQAPLKFDGFAGSAGQRAVVALNGRFPVDRLRFSALHEVGHVVLNFAEALDEKAREALCHRFAGAMLFPAEKFREAFGSWRQHIALEELVKLKSIHGISCAAILKRAGDLALLAPSTLDRIWWRWSSAGYRRKDPGTCLFNEAPRRFDLLMLRAVAENMISRDKATMLAGKSEAEFSKLEMYP